MPPLIVPLRLPRVVCRVVLPLLLLLSQRGLSQDITVPMDQRYYEKYMEPIKASYFHISLGASMANGQFKELPAASNTVVDPFTGKSGLGAGLGFALEGGFTAPYGGTGDRHNSMYPIWGAGVGLAWNPLRWRSLGGLWEDHAAAAYTQLGFQARTGLAYNLKNRAVIEFQLGLVLPVWLSPGGMSIAPQGEAAVDAFTISPVAGEWDRIPGGSVGLSIRTAKYRLGGEWCRQVVNSRYSYVSNIASGEVETFFSGETVWSTLRVHVARLF